jgi:hypothetical protein
MMNEKNTPVLNAAVPALSVEDLKALDYYKHVLSPRLADMR